MRYIGLDPNTRTVVQIDGNKSAYVNVKSFGASGLDRYFTGSVGGASGNGTSIYINQISDYTQYEEDYFVVGREITAFFLTNTSAPSTAEYGGIFTSADIQPVGAIRDTSLSTAKNIEYFIFPYNVETGRFSPYSLDPELTGLIIQDPKTDFDDENYVQITFNRSSASWVPVIYRRYNGRVDFLGVIGNNALQTSTQVTFYDRGTTQIPSWDEAAINVNGNAFLPEFLTSQLSLGGINGGPIGKAVIGKKNLKIISKNEITGVVEFADAADNTVDLTAFAGAGTTVKFKFDDTKPIQDTINWAKNNSVKNVFFPTGTYNVSHIKLYDSVAASAYSGISLFGTGLSSIIKKGPSVVNPTNSYGTIGILGTGTTNRIDGITIKDLAFDGNKRESIAIRSPQNDVYGISSKYQDFIAMEYADSISVQNCSFYNGNGSALYALQSEKINLTNNRIYQLSKPYEPNVPPVKIRETDKLVAQGNLFENCSAPADFTGIDVSVVNNNIINNCGDTGIELIASDNWNAQGNLTYNSSGSIVQSTDLYQNEYSRASLAVKRGIVMAPTYFTVTDGQLPVEIAEDSIRARVYPLNSSYAINTSGTAEYLQIVEAKQQTDAGIFAVTAPVATINSGSGGSNQGLKIKGTNDYALLDIDNPVAANRNYGYAYKITATVRLGNFPISRITADPNNSGQVRMYLKNSADLLQLNFFAGGNASNSSISTSGVRIAGTPLASWTDGTPFTVLGIDSTNSYVRIGTPASVSNKFTSGTEEYAIRAGNLNLIQNNYFIADGNIYVSD